MGLESIRGSHLERVISQLSAIEVNEVGRIVRKLADFSYELLKILQRRHN